MIEATRKFLSNVNATRKYHNILGFVMDSADSKTAMSRLEVSAILVTVFFVGLISQQQYFITGICP